MQLRPETLDEVRNRSNPHIANQLAELDASRWPHWDIQLEERVQINGLKTRPDLEHAEARVVGLCFKTKRIGVRLIDGATMMVLNDRLTPLEDD